MRESIMARRNSSKVPFVVVGNKCDMESGRKVGQEQAKEWATSIKAPFLETSAKVGVVGVVAFVWRAWMIHDLYLPNTRTRQFQASIRVTDAFHVLVREVWRQRKKTVAAKKKSRCLVM